MNISPDNWKLFIFVVRLFIFELITSTVIILIISTNQIQTTLTTKINQVREDINYSNQQWDITSYNTDPILLGEYPLYFITTDGFVLDRRSPIHGFLDISDYKKLLVYQHIQTVKTIANQTRRVYAQPILYNNATIGVIAVSYFNPHAEILPSIDSKLMSTLKMISSEIKISKGTIDVSAVDQRKLPYNVSFTIVDKYNTILKKTTNVNNTEKLVNFIDTSYVKAQLTAPVERIIQDSQNREIFLIQTAVLKDKQGMPLGVIIVGQTISPLISLLLQYVFWQGIVGLIIVIITFFIVMSRKKEVQEEIVKNQSLPHIAFNETTGILSVDTQEITIPYATNQFYLLQALFHKPSKRWETDELLKKFGVDDGYTNARKVYDAMVKINNKVQRFTPHKLVLNQNKTYQLNTSLITG